MYNAVDVLSSSLSAMRLRVNTIASNIANAETTKTADGGPYKRKDIVIEAKPLQSQFSNALDEMTMMRPSVAAVVEDQSAPKLVYQPWHPDANKEGNVAYPNINVVESMTDLMSASRAYEANVNAIRQVKNMTREALRISSVG